MSIATHRIESVALALEYSTDSGSNYTTSTEWKGDWGAGTNFLSETGFVKSSVDFNAYKVFALTKIENARIRLTLVDTDSKSQYLTETTDSIWDLRPQGVKWIAPYDFGEADPEFIIKLPELLRSQKIQPLLTISETADFSQNNTTLDAFYKSIVNEGQIGYHSKTGSSITLSVDSNQTFQSGDLISLYDTNTGTGQSTYAIASVDNTNNRITINGTFDTISNGKYKESTSTEFETGHSSAKFTYHGINNTRIKIKWKLSGITFTAGKSYYYKYDLRCTNS